MPLPITADDLPLSFREFAMNETVPLSAIHHAVLTYLQDRTDIALFGAQAVNAYVDQPRMTEDVDVMSTDGQKLADQICAYLHQELNLATRVRNVAAGKGFRVYQVRKPRNRHLVDVREVDTLPDCQLSNRILVVEPSALIALKVVSMTARPNTPKGVTDQADLMRLLMTFPHLRSETGPVVDCLVRQNADERTVQAWKSFAAADFQPDDDDAF